MLFFSSSFFDWKILFFFKVLSCIALSQLYVGKSGSNWFLHPVFTVYPVFTCFHREDLPARMAEVEGCFSAENPSSLLQVQTRHLLRCWTRSPRRRSCPNRPTCRPQMRSSSWRSNHPSIERSVEQKHVKHLDLWNNIHKIKRCDTNTVGIWITSSPVFKWWRVIWLPNVWFLNGV